MKKVFIYLYLLICLNTTGQITHEFGPENIPLKDLELQEMLGGEDGYFFIHKINTDENPVTHFIQKIDRKTLLPIDTKEVLITDDNNEVELVRLVYNNDEFTAFIKKNKKKSKMVSVNAISFDAGTLTKIKENELESFEMENYYTPFIDVKLNTVTEKVLIKVTSAKTQPQGLFSDFFIYDLTKGKKEWEKSINENFKEKTPLIRDGRISNGIEDTPFNFELDNENTIHYTHIIKVQGSLVKEYLYELHYNYFNTKTLEEKDILLPTAKKTQRWDIKILKNKNNSTSIIGLFVGENPEKNIEEKTGGIFIYNINNSKGEIISKFFYNNSEFNKTNELDNNPKHLLKKVTLDDAYCKDDYSIIIGHKYINTLIEHVDARTLNKSNPVNDYMIGDYYDIFVLKINQSGAIEFYTQLPFAARLQHAGQNYIVKQFVESFNNDNLYIFHNEHPETTALLEANDKIKAYPQIFGSSKHLVCNKINLKDGSNRRTVILIPEKNKFMTVLFDKYKFCRPEGAVIYNRYKNHLFLPISYGKRMERILQVTLN